MGKIRILVADDSVVIRQMLVHVLSEDPELEVVGTAPDGEIALAKIPQFSPDLVLLDVEMPKLDGLETLRRIRKDYPHLPVIMFSSFTRLGAEATVDALLLGAQDYEEKPTGTTSREQSFDLVRQKLIPKIKALCPEEQRNTLTPSSAKPTLSSSEPLRSQQSGRIDAVVIGVSTGGPTALAAILPSLPASFPVPILIVQHMPPIFTETLAQRLTSKSALEVKEGREGENVTPGLVWLAPGDFHMVLKTDGDMPKIKITQGPHVNSCRPAVDLLFQSAAEVYGNRLLGVILTGMGQDGLRGCEAIREHGGQVLIQDEKTSVVWGMPGAVSRAGLANSVLPLNQIGPEILKRVQAHRTPAAAIPKGAL